MKRPGSISSSVAALLLVALLPLAVSAQYTEEDRKQAIDAVASFFDDMGDSETAKAWRSGWERGIYTFETLDGGTWASVEPPGNERIRFNESRMLPDLASVSGPSMPAIASWAATYEHERVHTRQSKYAFTISDASQLLGQGHPHEAEAWTAGLQAYWRWLRKANRNYSRATSTEQRETYARQVAELAELFGNYYKNYLAEKHGPLPEGTGFLPLGGTDATPLTIEEALKQAEQIGKKAADQLHLAVRFKMKVYRVNAGETITLVANVENEWGSPSFTWTAGSGVLSETSKTLTRTATDDETITVTVHDDRNQKASASCKVIVNKPADTAATPKAPSPKPPATTTPPPTTVRGTPAWVLVGKRTNDWQSRLDRQNASMKEWQHSVSASEGSVTIKNTYTGSRKDMWMRNGMSESGTATWTPPSKSTIRPGDVVSIDLTTTNAPRDHPNFFGIISVKAETWRLGKDGNRVGAPAGFADKKGQSVLGYGYPRGNQPKSTLTMTVSRTFDAGAREGVRMAIYVTAQGVSEMVQTEYIYEWKTP